MGLHHGCGGSDIARRLYESQLAGESGELVRDQRGVFRGYPPDQIVFAGKSIRVFDGDLGFPNATHTTQCLDYCGSSRTQSRMQSVYQWIAPGKFGITRLYIPYRRQSYASDARLWMVGARRHIG